ncbi:MULTISPECIES: nucleoside-triphosphatase [Anaerolinea]|uniref:nucleoside-triphosphatase n=1 Tax=Anaerolinea TaxID=233189 RepID=UPI002601F7B8|nr:nucleoside-triphosphatase [Anaerolinea thermophila]
MAVNLWIVTGWRGSGKTTFCREMVQAASRIGLDPAGLISPAGFKQDQKDSIWAEAIRSGEKRLLATDRPRTQEDLAFGDWYFNQSTLEWGNEVLKSSVPCDVLVIDELGPLEFHFSLGWVSAMDVIRTGNYHLALVVVRPELLETAKIILQPVNTIQMTNVEEVNSRVLQFTPLLFQVKEIVCRTSM